MIDLKEEFGDTYRFGFDPAALIYKELQSDAGYLEIPCKYGRIYPFSDEFLAFWCMSPARTRRIQRGCPELLVRSVADNGEAIFLFRPADLKLYEAEFKPRRKKRLSPEHKAKLAQANKRHRFGTKMPSGKGKGK